MLAHMKLATLPGARTLTADRRARSRSNDDETAPDTDVHNARIMNSLSRSQAVIEFTPTGEIIDANQNFLDALGYTIDEIRGKHHRMFVESNEAASDRYRRFWANLGEGRFASSEFVRVNKRGDKVWIQATYNPVLDDEGAVISVIKFATDITRQKESQKEIQDRSSASIEFEPDGTILDANDLFLATVGYRHDEIVGRHHSIFMPPGEADSADYRAFWPALAAGQFVQGEFHRVDKFGHDLWLQGAYNPVFDSEGEVIRVVKGVSDITETMKAKERAARVGQDIAESVSEMGSAIAEIAENVHQTASLAQTAEANTSEVRDMVQALDHNSASIESVVTVIHGLSEQTNLLALNATIEAARAGAGGKGFAVVASEVKALATQTSAATTDIRADIAAIQADVRRVVDAIDGITAGVTEVSEHTSTVAAAVEEQSVVMDSMKATAQELLDVHDA